MDLGNEPPLSADGGTGAGLDRRRVSVQWFSGTILTGLCGATLMGGAVFASLDGETNFATLPERFEGMLRSALSGGPERTITRKGDRLPAYADPTFARQVIRVTTTTRVGNREIVRVRPFVRIAGNLSLSVSELSANIPPFNPQRMLAEAVPDAAAEAAALAAAPDAEVSFVTRDLAGLLPRIHLAVSLPVDEVLAQVREAANWTGGPARPGVPGLTGTRLAYAAEGNPDPYAGFEARIVPENITLLPKTTTEATGGNPWNERVVVPKKGETVFDIVRELGATPDEAKAIVALLGPHGLGGELRDGHKLRILLSPADSSRRLKPVRVIVAGDSAVEAVVAFSDAGRYVSVDLQNANSEIAQASETEEDNGAGMRLYQSIYETAFRDQVPRSVIEDLVRIYSYDVDYQRKVQPGDSFEVLYAAEDETPGSEGKSDVMFAELTVGGETKKFYRFQTPDDGVVDYYDESGKSAKKFLVRKPIGRGIMRSGFGFRRHPILGYSKMHTGVDWTAPYGTPIFAAGNGVVEKAGWESGYGKYVRVRHNNGYQTAYGHMTAFARDLDEGVRVRQGQVIGFVGSTGLSTGAHVHYEILVNGRFVDPMRIRLPRGRSLDGGVLASFEQERDRIDAMKAWPPVRTAHTTR
ncbi:MAG: peptidoglycan DD-metalloendopeptidase family protein [Rhizobiales bacterium]|nr:peptidoglycan DD-metalloendopeptidase family protein [Hyphomicrobiales bacterium]